MNALLGSTVRILVSREKIETNPSDRPRSGKSAAVANKQNVKEIDSTRRVYII